MIEIDGQFFEEPINNIFEIYFDSLSPNERTCKTLKYALELANTTMSNLARIFARSTENQAANIYNTVAAGNVMPDEFLSFLSGRQS